MNRRELFAAGTAVAVLAAPAIAIAAPTSWGTAIEEAKAVCALRRQVDAGATDAVIAEWERRFDAFLEWAETLPNTPENARFKALAIRVIHDESPEMPDFSEYGNRPTDHRLAVQIVQSLVSGAL